MSTSKTLRHVDGAVSTEIHYDDAESLIHELTVKKIHLPQFLETAIASRRADFLAGRYCAHESLRALHCVEPEVGVGPHREPLWPRGYVGSIAHTTGFALAFASSETHSHSIGIDCERIPEVLDERIAGRIFLDGEFEGLRAAYPEQTPEETFTIGFAAKESIYKALFPLVRTYMGFRNAFISPGILPGTLSVAMLKTFAVPAPVPSPYLVHWRRHGKLVITQVNLRKS